MTRKKISAIERRNLKHGLLFTSPAIIGLAFLTLYPVLKSPKWVGTANYAHLVQDKLLIQSLVNTAYYAAFSVPVCIAVAFLLALLLNQKVKGMALFRTLFYLPSIVPMVASSVLWLWILNPQYGLLNTVLGWFGIPGPGWMADPTWSKPALVIMSAWGVGPTMIIFLAGLQDVPKELNEAAEIDGASALHRVRHITLPFMSPYIFFSLVMGLIGASQYFTQAYVMTNGSGAPANSTLFFAMYLFQNAFHYFKMGYACAMAWLLFVLILGATLIIFKSSAKHVYYGER
jgi:multiple sugar transport system permease protein